MAELEQVLVRQRGKETTSYTASPFESALSTVLRENFRAVLGVASIDRYKRLVRVSTPKVVNGSILAFRYTRFDILKSAQCQIIEAYKKQNPDFVSTSPESDNYYDRMWADMEDADRIRSELEKGMESREGTEDPLKVLTDPKYYGLTVARWPESFEVSLFEKANEAVQLRTGNLVRKRSLNGKKPDIHGVLSIPGRLEGVSDYSEGRLVIRFPRVFYTSARAFATAYESDTLNIVRRSNIEIDQVDWFPTGKPLEYPVFPTHDSPQEIMGRFGKFVEELTLG